MADTTHMPRRGFLKGAALAAPVMALGAAALALPSTLPVDPHPALWTEWQRLRATYNARGFDTESQEGEAVWAEFMAVEDRLRMTPATTPEGLVAQFEYMAEDMLKGSMVCDEFVEQMVAAFRAGLATI